MIQTVVLDRIDPAPWRNGGGQTRELLAWPTAQDWALRISVAEVRKDGPFSAFPGIDRHFAVLAGAGVLLRWPAPSLARRELLTDGSAPVSFDGGQAPECELLGGPTVDLNLMVRRDAGQGTLASAAFDQAWFDTAPWRAVFTSVPARLQIDDADACRLPANALAWSDHAARQRWRLVGDDERASAWWMTFGVRSGIR